MRRMLHTLLICLLAQSTFSQSFPKKQTLIPLNNISGVPFYKDQELNDIIINGFEVDAKGNLYFFGGKLPCLAVFNGTKQIYRKTYKELGSGAELHLFKGNFYNLAFNKKGDQVSIRINMADGAISITNSPFVSKHFAAYTIIDSCILLKIPTKSMDDFDFEKYDLSGKFLGKVTNEFGIPIYIFPDKKKSSDWDLLGMWNGNYIFWSINFPSKYEKLCMVNNDGEILATKLLPVNFSGNGYAENPSEDRKVRNGSLFVLGRKGNYALLTEVPLQTLFYK